MNRQFIILFLAVFSISGSAQNFLRPNEWKKYRREVFFNIGSANFLGDLGGRNKKGTDYSPADLNFNQTRTDVAFGARYKLDKVINVAAKFSYMNVKGDDAKTQDKFRHNRNLNFKSNIYELSIRGEYGWQSSKRGTSKYGIKQTYGKLKNITHSIYGFAGLGFFYFNPKGKPPTGGKYVALRPLHTEGQGLPGGPKQYKRYSVSLPVGAYYKLTFNKIISVGIELCYRKTFTDYIDDVGSVYYDPSALNTAYGPLSAQMSDPSLGEIFGATHPDGYGNPAQRGDNEKDSFVSLEITACYIFKKARKSARLRSKF